MKKKLASQEARTVEGNGLSRRGFLTGSGAILGGLAATAGLTGIAATGCTPQASAEGVAFDGKIIPKSMGYVYHDPEICSGCRTCELICSLYHEGVINPELSRNHVEKDFYSGYITDVQYCRQCLDPKCLKACPAGAMYTDEKTGARVIDQEKCVGCKLCMDACIYAPATPRIKYNPKTNTCFKCDLCGGDPMCVKYCPIGATRVSWQEYTIRKPGWDLVDKYASVQGLDVEIIREFNGQYGSHMVHRTWAVEETSGGVEVKGTFDSGAGQALKMVMHCEAYDASGKLLATSDEHIYQLSIHELMDYVQPIAIANPSQIATIKVIADVSLWVYGTDEEK